MQSTLDLRGRGPIGSLLASVRFLPVAWRIIEQKEMAPFVSFRIHARNGSSIALSCGDLSYPATTDDLTAVERLVLRLEDRRFLRHRGVDVFGIGRAAVRNLQARKIVQGGSTITQQLVRNTLVSPDRSLVRKALELLLATKVERHYTKAEILRLYCQYVYLGPGIRGFSAAARVIYRKPVSQLSFYDLCGLVGLLRAPSITFPNKTSDAFRARRATVARLLEPGHDYTPSASQVRPIHISRFRAPRLSHLVRSALRKNDINPIDLTDVTTTIDTRVQTVLDEIVREASEQPAVRQVAGVVLSVSRGEVLGEAAWQEGKPCEFSPAFLGSVQPGSTFKPFAMLSALEQGFLETMSLESSPFESSFLKGARRAPWSVKNYGRIYRGTISLQDALVVSDNTAFARLVELLNIEALGATYARFGLTPEGGRVSPSIALGAHLGGVSLVQLASAYAALANGGVYLPPRVLRAVAFADGRIWWATPAVGRLVVKDGQLIVSLGRALRGAADALTSFGFAGKTGTTHTGTLFAGYSRELSVVLWGEYRREQSEHDPKTVTALRWATRFARRIFDVRRRLSI